MGSPSNESQQEEQAASTPALVVVIVGASSGIGSATAEAFAKRGCKMILAARNVSSLEPVVAACRAAGVATLGFPIDVTDSSALERLAQRAMSHFGPIDVWINATGMNGSGLIGHLHAARVALRHFRESGRGLLVNLNAMNGAVETHPASVYGMSGGLSQSLRAEVSDLPEVYVCDVAPTVRDDVDSRDASPVFDPRRAARAIVALAYSPSPRAVTRLTASAAPMRTTGAREPRPQNLAVSPLTTAMFLGAVGIACGWLLGRRRR